MSDKELMIVKASRLPIYCPNCGNECKWSNYNSHRFYTHQAIFCGRCGGSSVIMVKFLYLPLKNSERGCNEK